LAYDVVVPAGFGRVGRSARLLCSSRDDTKYSCEDGFEQSLPNVDDGGEVGVGLTDIGGKVVAFRTRLGPIGHLWLKPDTTTEGKSASARERASPPPVA
jgi:hypothetical protein